MLEDRFYLYRPWIPICKSIEAEVIGGLELKGPVLDIGCGTGLFGKYCFKEKIDTGLDCDENAVEEARLKDVYGKLEVGDACNLPFSKNSFNAVVSVCAVEHIPRLDRVLSNAYRVLKKKGQFIFTVPSVEFGGYLFSSKLLGIFGLKKKAVRYAEEKNRKSGHIHVYNEAVWKKLLGEEGFKIESIDHIFPGEAVFMWSFFHSLPFKIAFLPFRLFRNANIKFIDNLLRAILNKLLSAWLKAHSHVYDSNGGYLLIQAQK